MSMPEAVSRSWECSSFLKSNIHAGAFQTENPIVSNQKLGFQNVYTPIIRNLYFCQFCSVLVYKLDIERMKNIPHFQITNHFSCDDEGVQF